MYTEITWLRLEIGYETLPVRHIHWNSLFSNLPLYPLDCERDMVVLYVKVL